MSRRVTTNTYHDPLNLVRVPENPLQREAFSVMQTLQQQRGALQSSDIRKDEFDEVEVNLDKWKQRRKTSVSKTSQESFEDLPHISSTMQTNTRFTTADQRAEVGRHTGMNADDNKQSSAKMNFQVQKPFEEKLFVGKADNGLLRRGDDLSNVPRKEARNTEEAILRPKAFSKQAIDSGSSIPAEKTQDPPQDTAKSYVRKSESRFKNAKAFFEQSFKQESDVVMRPQKTSDRSQLRKSWAPGMMDKTFSKQPPSKLPIANDKEFTIEEIDLSKPVVRMSTSESRPKVNFTPRFVPNVESNDEVILRKKSDSSNAERKSRMEVISVDLSDKTPPVISLDDFKSIIISPEVRMSDENLKLTEQTVTEAKSLKKESNYVKDEAFKDTIFIEDKVFKNKIFNDDIIKEKYKITDNAKKQSLTETKQKNEGIEDDFANKLSINENVYNDNEFLKEGLFKISDYKKANKANESQKVVDNFKNEHQNLLEKQEQNYKRFEASKERQAPVSFNDVKYTSVRNEKVSDILQKKMEDRKAFFQSDLDSGNKSEISVNTKQKDKAVPSSTLLEPLKSKEVYKGDQSENPFKLFEETYKNQLDELNQRKARDSLKISSNILNEDKVETNKIEKMEDPFVPTHQTENILKKTNNDDVSVGGHALIKTEDSLRFRVKEEQLSLTTKDISKDVNTNLISFNNDKDVSVKKFAEKIDFKLDSIPKKQDTLLQKEFQLDAKDHKSSLASSEEEPKVSEQLFKVPSKPLPKVAPKPMSKTSKIIEKLASTGFTPVLPGAAPKRSKSMKVFGTPITTVARGVEVDEVGVDMDENWSPKKLLDTSAQKNKSAIAKSAKRRPPTMYQTRGRLSKMHTFDCSNGFDSKPTDSQTPRCPSADSEELSQSPPNLPSRPPPEPSIESLDPFHPSTSPPQSTFSSLHQPVDFIDDTSRSHGDRHRKEEITEEEEEEESAV